jgi:hypothetical protein
MIWYHLLRIVMIQYHLLVTIWYQYRRAECAKLSSRSRLRQLVDVYLP